MFLLLNAPYRHKIIFRSYNVKFVVKFYYMGSMRGDGTGLKISEVSFLPLLFV